MNAISDGPRTLKFVHTYGAGLHGTESDPDVNDPRWQRRQVEDFVQFSVEAEELGFDGVTVTEPRRWRAARRRGVRRSAR